MTPENIFKPPASDVQALLEACRTHDYRGFADRYQGLPEPDAMTTAWEAADKVRATDQFPVCYDFAVRAQRERSVATMWGDIGLGLYRAMLEDDYDAYQRSRQIAESEIAFAIRMHLLEEAQLELADESPLRDDRHARLMAGYQNGNEFDQRFGLEQIKREHGI